MSRSYEWNILGRLVSAYVHDYRGDRGYEKGWHGRVSLYLDDRAQVALSVEYHVPSQHYSVSLHVGHDDEPVKAALNVGLFGVYVSSVHPALAKLRDAIIRAWPLKSQAYSFSGRDFSLSFHDDGVFWSVGGDDMGWSSSTPRWRQGAWHPLGHHMRQGEPELIEEREVLVPMPERPYRAKARLERTRWGFGKLPRCFDRIDYHVVLEMLPGEQIPHPGKGENSYDCGDDATFGMSAPGRTIEDGVGRLVASVLHSRRKYGGAKWNGPRTSVDEDRLRTIVDEAFGMHPVLEWTELLDVLEKELGKLQRRAFIFREAVHHLHLAMPPASLVALVQDVPTVRQAVELATGASE